MTDDKYTAVWVSHSSISDFLACPRSYYLKNVYKDPATGHKIQIITPPLALGQAVHEVVESLSILPTAERFKDPLVPKFEKAWKKITGIKGGFSTPEEEKRYFERGKAMLGRVLNHPGPLKNLAVKIKSDLPNYWLSPEDNIILCGKIDWLEYFPDTDSVHIIDFKTSKSEEDPKSLQLPIYLLLASHTQQRPVTRASYWYLELNDDLTEKPLPDADKAYDQILKIAKEIKLARSLSRFKCPHGDNGCRYCRPFEAILRGEGELVNVDSINRDIYVLPYTKSSDQADETDSVIL